MRKINSLFALIAATLLLAPSCKKRLIPLPLEFCNISEATVTQNGSPDTTVYHLSYDREGRPAAIQSSGGGGSSSRTYTYADTNLVVRTTSGGSTTTDSVTLNSQGLMLVDVDRNGSFLQTTWYFYSGTEVTSADICYGCETPPGPGPSTWQYNWSDGNLDAFIPQPGFTTTTSTTYSYNTTPAAIGDYFSIMQLLSSPAPVISATDQVDDVFQNYGTSAVTYSHYSNGRISGMTIITSGPAMFGYGAPDTVNYSYQYQCGIVSPILEKN